MAHGDTLIKSADGSLGTRSRTVALLDKALDNVDGPWLANDQFKTGSVTVKGVSHSALVHICGSNNNDPLTADNGFQIGADISADTIVKIDMPCRFIKARITALAGGPVSAPGISVIHHAVAP